MAKLIENEKAIVQTTKNFSFDFFESSFKLELKLSGIFY